MFQRAIDDLKESIGLSIRLTSLAAMAAIALFITTCFLCAAAFIAVLDRYGPVAACLVGAGIFFIVTLVAAISYVVRKKSVKVRARHATRSTVQSALADPLVVAAGLKAIRAVGIKKLIPILAVGGLALGFLASRGASGANDETPAE